jgi:hypothetical protein
MPPCISTEPMKAGMSIIPNFSADEEMQQTSQFSKTRRLHRRITSIKKYPFLIAYDSTERRVEPTGAMIPTSNKPVRISKHFCEIGVGGNQKCQDTCPGIVGGMRSGYGGIGALFSCLEKEATVKGSPSLKSKGSHQVRGRRSILKPRRPVKRIIKITIA